MAALDANRALGEAKNRGLETARSRVRVGGLWFELG
jgi:hypothetical protein